MGELLEVAKAFISPTEKLIASVQGAIGKMYEPRYVKRMADARAHEVSVLGEAMRNMCDITISYNKNGLELDTKDFDEFIKRTQSRIAYQELVKQQNLESVVNQSYDLLNGGPNVTSEPVDSDWLLRFFDSVQNVSNDEMQEIWAKILAGEVQSPGSFSLRTLECLKNLSQKEALSFQKILPFTIGLISSTIIPYESDSLKKYGVSYSDILMLDESGLLQSKNGLIYQEDDVKEEKTLFQFNSKYTVTVASRNGFTQKFIMPVIKLTSAGHELAVFLEKESNIDYLLGFFRTQQNSCLCKNIQIRFKKFVVEPPDNLKFVDLLEENESI